MSIVAGIASRVLVAALGTVIGLILTVVTAEPAPAEGRIVVASKIDTEGALLGNMIASLLEARGLAVENKLQLGPTNIVRAAIVAGQIDIYPEYTGNAALFFHLEDDPVEGLGARCGHGRHPRPRETPPGVARPGAG